MIVHPPQTTATPSLKIEGNSITSAKSGINLKAACQFVKLETRLVVLAVWTTPSASLAKASIPKSHWTLSSVTLHFVAALWNVRRDSSSPRNRDADCGDSKPQYTTTDSSCSEFWVQIKHRSATSMIPLLKNPGWIWTRLFAYLCSIETAKVNINVYVDQEAERWKHI